MIITEIYFRNKAVFTDVRSFDSILIVDAWSRSVTENFISFHGRNITGNREGKQTEAATYLVLKNKGHGRD